MCVCRFLEKGGLGAQILRHMRILYHGSLPRGLSCRFLLLQSALDGRDRVSRVCVEQTETAIGPVGVKMRCAPAVGYLRFVPRQVTGSESCSAAYTSVEGRGGGVGRAGQGENMLLPGRAMSVGMSRKCPFICFPLIGSQRRLPKRSPLLSFSSSWFWYPLPISYVG